MYKNSEKGKYIISQKKLILNLVKKRFLMSILNFFLFWQTLVFTGYIIEVLMGSSTKNSSSLLLLFFIIATWYLVYFGLFVKITNGYTLGGILLRLKTIKLDNSKLNIIQCLKRTFYSLFSNLKFLIFMMFSTLNINSLGQMSYDKKYNVTIIDVTKNKNTIEDVVAYQFTYYDFIIEIGKIWGFFFVFIIFLVLIQYLFSLII